jgi:hypothetical protein
MALNQDHDINETMVEEKTVPSATVAIRIKEGASPETLLLIEKATSHWNSRVDSLKRTIEAKSVGIHAFEVVTKDGVPTLAAPSNFYTLAESNDFFAIMLKCCLVLNYNILLLEDSVFNGSIADNKDTVDYLSGLILSLEETTMSLTNYSSASLLEQGRLEGQFRRALYLCSSLGLPFKWTKFNRYEGLASNGTNDTLYLRLLPIISDRDWASKIMLCFVKLYTRAQNALARSIKNIKQSDFCLSFDQVWNLIGDIQKDKSGRKKRSKTGEFKRYHPSLPSFNGMDKTEVYFCKEVFNPIWNQVTNIRNSWETSYSSPGMYSLYIKTLQSIYKAEVKAVKQVKAYVDQRVRNLGLQPTAPKQAIMGRIAQHKASETYDPVFTKEKASSISTLCINDIISECVSINKQCCDINASVHMEGYYDMEAKKAIPQSQYSLYDQAKFLTLRGN